MTVDEYVEQVLAQAPPLTAAQKARLVDLMRPRPAAEDIAA